MFKGIPYFSNQVSQHSGRSPLKIRMFACLFYPIAFWLLSKHISEFVQSKFIPEAIPIGNHFLHSFFYLFFGLPLTLFVSGEILISLNEKLLSEQANYRLQSDFTEGAADRPRGNRRQRVGAAGLRGRYRPHLRRGTTRAVRPGAPVGRRTARALERPSETPEERR